MSLIQSVQFESNFFRFFTQYIIVLWCLPQHVFRCKYYFHIFRIKFIDRSKQCRHGFEPGSAKKKTKKKLFICDVLCKLKYLIYLVNFNGFSRIKDGTFINTFTVGIFEPSPPLFLIKSLRGRIFQNRVTLGGGGYLSFCQKRGITLKREC